MALKDAGAGGIEWESVGGEDWYLVQVAAPLEDGEGGQYGPSIKWQFHVWDKAAETLLNEEDSPWWQWTSENMGKKANARKWIEALLNREVENGESGAELGEAIEGCWMQAFIAPNDNGTWKIDRVRPYTGEAEAEPVKAKAPAKPAAKPAAKAPAKAGPPKPAAKPAAAADPEAEIDPDDLPF